MITRKSARSAAAWPRLARTLVVKVEAVIDAMKAHADFEWLEDV